MSDSYTPLERAIARILGRFPVVKSIIKSCYSQLVYLRSKKDYTYKSNYNVTCLNADQNTESFFGYFDKTPVSKSGNILIHKTTEKTDCLPQCDKPLQIAVLAPSGEELLTVKTNTFNWQQGSRAHWLDEERFIFNDFNSNTQKYVSRVYSILTKQEVKQFDYAVQDSYKADYFLSLNYRRLLTMRPDYGYRNLSTLTESELKNTCGDGIWKVDFDSGKGHLLLSISDVKQIDYDLSFDDAKHKVNHVSISPSGEYFIFLHRYFVGQRRIDRLMLSSSDGKKVKSLAAFGMVSHCFWADDSTILGYLRGPGERDAYWLIDIHSGKMTSLADGVLDSYGDGHPHVVGDCFITDTYPDKSRMQYLLLCNWKTGSVENIGEFYHGFDFKGETRCDLHPRLSKDGSKVFFDSVFSGQRQLYCISLQDK